MPSKLFVGNLNFRTTQEELRALFETVGQVQDVFLPTDRATGRPRGFAFVEYANEADAQEATRKFNGHELGGRALKVNAAESRPQRDGMPRPRRAPEASFDAFGGGEDEERPRRTKGSRRNLRARYRSL